MFFWSLVTKKIFDRITWRIVFLASLAGMSFGFASEAWAEKDVKQSIVRIVSSGTRFFESGRVEPVRAYEGSGFIVFSREETGGAQTVIVTADHVLGYSKDKALDPNNLTFRTGDVRGDAPPVWVNRGDEKCSAELRVNAEAPESSEPCRRISIFYFERGQWQPYNTVAHVHKQGNKNQDVAVIWLNFAHSDHREIELGNASSLYKTIQQTSSIPSGPVMAWGAEAGQPQNDPVATKLDYRARDDGPTLLFQTPLSRGNSGGPIVFENKVVGVISAVQGDETRGTKISTVYDALSNWEINAVQAGDRVPSFELVRQIRCESRRAVIAILQQILLEFDRTDLIAQRLAFDIADGRLSIKNLNLDVFKGQKYVAIRRTIQSFVGTGIAYSFGPSPSFTLSENFENLLNTVSEKLCFPSDADDGNIRVDRLIRDFLDLSTLSSNFLGGGENKAPTLVDVFSAATRSNRAKAINVTVALAGVSRRNDAREGRWNRRKQARSSDASPSDVLALRAIDEFLFRSGNGRYLSIKP